jgi:nucleotide-binding universal stress UspA family protein
MAMIQNILFPVDFSPACAAMAPFVQRAGALLSAKVTLVHVFDPAAYSCFELYVRPFPEVEKERRDLAQEKLCSFLASEFPPDGNARLLVCGDVATQICELARERRFDLIVMPTHAGRFRRRLLGSTTAKVLDEADCPVMTTQHAETIAPRPLEHREWVCAIGLTADSERVLRYAAQYAATLHANLSIIHAIPGDPGLPVQLDLEEEVQSAERREARRRLDEIQRVVGSHARTLVAIGPVKAALLEAVRRSGADALMIGRSPEPGTFGRTRDLTYTVIRDAPCPVLSI